jgi:hypothetical protein
MRRGDLTRREWLGGVGTMGAGGAISAATWPFLSPEAEAADKPRPKVAAVFTELRLRSHAYHILTSLMGPYLFRGKWTEPGVEVVSFYADQFPRGDMAREASERFKVPLYKTIDEALCLGGKSLAVDAVLLIGEHGRYPKSELGQTMYPRKQFFDQIAAVVERSGRGVPVFNDKHLSYRWDWAKAMYDDARRLKMPLMAGSSVPLAERKPPLDFPAGAEVEEAVSIHGGGIESYDFHALEVMQSLIEARKGGETGVKEVQLLAGDAARKAAEEGRWSGKLVQAAMDAERNANKSRRGGSRPIPAEPFVPRHAVLVTYRDGTRGTAMTIGGDGDRWNFACRLRGRAEPLATAFYSGPWGNWNLFCALSHAIAGFFKSGEAPYPVERTLLVSGILDAAMHSQADGGRVVATPELDVAYAAKDFSAFRETGESWRVITADMPEPTTFQPGSG